VAEMDRAHVSRIERGIENPAVIVIDRIAKALGMTSAVLGTPPGPGETLPPVLPKGCHPRC